MGEINREKEKIKVQGDAVKEMKEAFEKEHKLFANNANILLGDGATAGLKFKESSNLRQMVDISDSAINIPQSKAQEIDSIDELHKGVMVTIKPQEDLQPLQSKWSRPTGPSNQPPLFPLTSREGKITSSILGLLDLLSREDLGVVLRILNRSELTG